MAITTGSFSDFAIPEAPKLVRSSRLNFGCNDTPKALKADKLSVIPARPQWIYGLNMPSSSYCVGSSNDNKDSAISKETISNIANLFCSSGDSDYNINSRTITNGFINELQLNLSSIIPTVINDVCFSYYFQSDSKYVLLAYDLFQSNSTQSFAQNDLLSIIEDNHRLKKYFQNDDDLDKICQKLVSLNLVQLKSFHTTFLSLFKDSIESQSVSKVKYRLTYDAIDAFTNLATDNKSTDSCN